jgi:hypothetical protein
MSGSAWETLGEKVGFGLAAIVLGPHAALERRARRSLRLAMVGWAEAHQQVKREAPRGALRRSVTLRAGGEPIDVDLELELAERRTSLAFAIARLPGYVDVTVDKDAGRVRNMKLRRLPPRAAAGAFRLDGDELDLPTAQALVEAIASGPFGHLEAIEIALTPERVTIATLAPSSREGWTSIGEGIAHLVGWLVDRWPPSYR